MVPKVGGLLDFDDAPSPASSSCLPRARGPCMARRARAPRRRAPPTHAIDMRAARCARRRACIMPRLSAQVGMHTKSKHTHTRARTACPCATHTHTCPREPFSSASCRVSRRPREKLEADATDRAARWSRLSHATPERCRRGVAVRSWAGLSAACPLTFNPRVNVQSEGERI